MNESLLHYFWKNKIFSIINLKTINNQSLQLVHTGFPHQDAGPDFKQAIIKIDDITWVGDVEIHVHTSDWFHHKHQCDDKYQSIILHVVYEHDTNRVDQFPTLELKNYISPLLIEEYRKLSLSYEPLPCKFSLPEVSALQFTAWYSRVAAERLLRKQKEIFETLHHCQENWHTTAFQTITTSFGFRTNVPAFSLLAKSISYKYIIKHSDSRLQIYALIFGQAGMLEDEVYNDDYYQSLKNEYQYLRYKYQLIPIPFKIWNLLRLRPQNFPCIRLAQISEMLYKIPDLIHSILNYETESVLRSVAACEPHDYWKTHRHFGQPSPQHSCRIGKSAINSLIINIIVPIQFAYATFIGSAELNEKSLNILEKADFEKNSITEEYVKAGFPSGNALYSQAILELHQHYCLKRRCLECDIGCRILQKSAP